MLVVHIPDCSSKVFQILQSCRFSYVKELITQVCQKPLSKHSHGASQLLFCGNTNSARSVTRLDEVRVVVDDVMQHLVKHMRSHYVPSMKNIAIEPTRWSEVQSFKSSIHIFSISWDVLPAFLWTTPLRFFLLDPPNFWGSCLLHQGSLTISCNWIFFLLLQQFRKVYSL